MEFIIFLLPPLIGAVIGAGTMVTVNKVKKINLDNKVENIITKAKKEAERIKRDSFIEAKEEAHKLKSDTDKEISVRKSEIKDLEARLLQREQNIDRRDETLQKREELIDERENNLLTKQRKVSEKEEEIEEVFKEQIKELEKITKLSREQAEQLLMKKIEEQMSLEIAAYIKERESEAKLSSDQAAKELLITSMEKYAMDMTGEQTVTVVNLPSDEMKGRIIGREGRNIRAIEAITGVDLIIDDTPEAIVLSSFDPLRREIARVTLEQLIKDGRIHPTRVEELYAKTAKEINDRILEKGKEATYELGLTKIDPELIRIIGRLAYRTSYGQNALMHSMEVAKLSGLMAAELGENVILAKRAGLLHDIAKAIDTEVEGSHVELGVELAQKYHENEVVINAIASHHGDTNTTSIISSLVGIADTLSAARPGARNDSLEAYIKRLTDLEKLARDIKGVEKAYALQAGRELRVLVKPEEVDDLTSYKIAREIKEQIENTMQYPGTVKVTVIRETRVTEEAK